MSCRRAMMDLSRPSQWWVMLALVSLIGQLVVMGAGRPGEMPRATIERLIGQRIVPASAVMPDCGMPGMGHVTARSGTADKSDKPGHDADAPCFLCPLLTLAPAIFQVMPSLPRPRSIILRRAWAGLRARAPPAATRRNALPRGPPVSLREQRFIIAA
ncbi:DUF2946 domain-containing protein [Brytella acorum]|uniref:DUF2946 domain-containing protein n=1 Tax=Brytella acorum TaxID=2959299 RepID=A0AA35VB14_9PROT|nr:DUF2946 domain-containing protein [Brytella acorum]MDF3625117.1 DUF2946 domain-containing protein [Brytella acorum]CAI9121004.1 DUF2946 domain-containing protein [Brytella acorum]